MGGESTPMERIRALDHLSTRDAAKEWGVPKHMVKNAAEQIRQIREGVHGTFALQRPRCPEPVVSFYGFPCKLRVEERGKLCYIHRKAKGHPGPDAATDALIVVQAQTSGSACGQPAPTWGFFG